MKIVAIIPAYNEERTISEVIKSTKKYVDEVIVIDDGSKDKTSEMSKFANFVATHPINMGKGVALKTGFEAAIKRGADIIITLDADGQHDPNDIPKLINILTKEKADIVIGSRKLNEKMPLIFKFGNWFLNKLFTFLFKQAIADTQSGFRAFRANIYDKIKWTTSTYAVETEMLANAGKKKLICKETPIETLYLDKYKGTTIFDGISIFFRMLSWKLRRD